VSREEKVLEGGNEFSNKLEKQRRDNYVYPIGNLEINNHVRKKTFRSKLYQPHDHYSTNR